MLSMAMNVAAMEDYVWDPDEYVVRPEDAEDSKETGHMDKGVCEACCIVFSYENPQSVSMMGENVFNYNGLCNCKRKDGGALLSL
jgi:hypothetical protein